MWSRLDIEKLIVKSLQRIVICIHKFRKIFGRKDFYCEISRFTECIRTVLDLNLEIQESTERLIFHG